MTRYHRLIVLTLQMSLALPSEWAAEGSVIVFNPRSLFKFERHERNDSDMFHSSAVSIRPLLVLLPSLPFPSLPCFRARENICTFVNMNYPLPCELTGSPVQYVCVCVCVWNVSTRRDPPGVHSQRNELRTRNIRNCGDSRVERKRERDGEVNMGATRGDRWKIHTLVLRWSSSSGWETERTRNQRYFCR